jgi:hypothetical protein
MITEYKLLIEVYKLVENDKVELVEVLSTITKKYSQFSLSNTTPTPTAISGTSLSKHLLIKIYYLSLLVFI